MGKGKLTGDGDKAIAHHQNDIDEHENKKIELIGSDDKRQDANDGQQDGDAGGIAPSLPKHTRRRRRASVWRRVCVGGLR